jgi:hypothetical protein
MIKVVTSVTVFNDAVGKRMSIGYSEVDEETGKIISDNKRIDRVVTDASVKSIIDELNERAQSYIDAIE